MKHSRHAVAALGLLALTLFRGTPLLAHGGEDHGAAVPPVPTHGVIAVADSSDTFELVAHHERLSPKTPTTLRLFLSDFRTNRPVSGARISLDLSGPSSVAVSATPGGPGEYAVEVAFPVDGEYLATVTVETDDTTDLLSLNGFKVGERFYSEPQTVRDARGSIRVKAIAGVLVVALTGLLLFWLTRRRRAATVALFLAVTLVASGSRPVPAHGGEDHGEATPGQAAARNFGDAVVLTKPMQFLLGIETDLAELQRLAPVIRLVGRVEPAPDGQALVLAPFDGVPSFPAGRVVRPGLRVRAGETVALLAASFDVKDQLEFTARKREAEAAHRKAESALRVALANHERAQQLLRVLSERERQEIQASYDSASADLDAATQVYESLAALERQQNRVAIVSPIDGVITEVHVTTGNVVEKDSKLLRVIDLTKLWIHGEAYENQLAALAHATSGWVDVPALSKSYGVRLLSRGLAIDPPTRTAHVYFTISDPDGALIPELSATIHVETGEPEETLAVAKDAVFEVEGRQVVFVHTAPEEFRAREVETGWANERSVEIVRGLEQGERVVVRGGHSLRGTAGGGR